MFTVDTLNRAVEQQQLEQPKLRARTAQQPAAWKPGVVWDGEIGEITTVAMSQPTPHFEDILQSWGYDPEHYELIEPVKVTTWDVQTKEGTDQLWSYKAGIRKRNTSTAISYDDLVREIKKHRKLNEKTPTGDLTFIACIADTQFGKADGDGTEGTIKRFLDSIDGVEQRIKELRKIGRKLGTLVVVGMGDIIEGCDGQYASQSFTVELNRREQIRVARRLIRDAIARWSKLFKNVIVTAVPGNHAEHRKDGKMFTERGDNDDVAIFEVLAEIFAANPGAYGHIKFLIPDNDIYVVLELSKTIIGFTHGHITKGGSTPQAKLKSWWEDQTFGHRPIGDASILVSAHYHHFSCIEYGKKIHIQCPSADGGSEWWEDLTGQQSRTGLLTFVLGDEGYQDLEII